MYNGAARNSSSATTPDSTDETSISSDGRKSPGKLSYETAALYIRRKSRERRLRNCTIAVSEDAWKRCFIFMFMIFFSFLLSSLTAFLFN
jgi:hypothetical protein